MCGYRIDRRWIPVVVGFISLFLPLLLPAQGQIGIVLTQPPPNQLKVADLWRIRLTNTTGQTIKVYLYGTADEAKDGPIVAATTAVFDLPPGVKTVTGNDIQPIDADYFNDRYKQFFLRTGQAPTGDYRVCVRVIDAATRAELGTDCYDQVVQIVTPPVLVNPDDESTVNDRLPVFSWIAPTPLKPGQRPTYQLKIVEILGRQTPYDAMMSNPAFFTRERIPSQLFAFPIAARGFRADQRYAWRITATDGDFPLGQSEIWFFTWKPITTDRIGEDTTTTIAYKGKTNKGPIIGKPPITMVNLERGVQAGGTFYMPNQAELVEAGVVQVSDNFIPAALLNDLVKSCFGP